MGLVEAMMEGMAGMASRRLHDELAIAVLNVRRTRTY